MKKFHFIELPNLKTILIQNVIKLMKNVKDKPTKKKKKEEKNHLASLCIMKRNYNQKQCFYSTFRSYGHFDGNDFHYPREQVLLRSYCIVLPPTKLVSRIVAVA